MDQAKHIPSLAHLRDFARARNSGRATHVAADRQQVTAPSDNKFFAFAYEKFLTAVIEYVNNGCRGGALERAVENSSSKMHDSYAAAAQGLTQLLAEVQPISARRRQRNIVAVDDDGEELVSLRVHLIFELANGDEIAALFYFSERRLTPIEMTLVETATALAVGQADPTLIPAILLARTGQLVVVDSLEATSSDRVAFLQDEAAAYKDEWVLSA
ncbi:hypothetical protein IFT77_15210 [Frigoribacterium sp. CFBP 13729]|uniref:hypothetical protein n=1 Tax=Frigoribacterium sp. CFBP 13729 TaxID=2775293 RepID=UPI0017876241|nr:hypothetical protein [Frigoribacterium sp. CFBP 13729]MBD8611836.1 hypothetical protein [Frigoribacterium sp. CFBP 13729]